MIVELNMATIQSSVFWLVCGVLSLFISDIEGKTLGQVCDPSQCRLPDCFCSGTVIPGGLSAASIPQMIMMSFDDAVNEQVYPYYQTLFDGNTKNPNGCPITATFFVSHEYTQYNKVQTLYHDRHEIADHSISHREPISWWKSANYSELDAEIAGQREILRKWGNVKLEDVRGYRAPFLQIGGNTEFKVLYDEKFTYEASMPTQDFMNPPMWPYTLDYQTSQECVIPPCPTGKCGRNQEVVYCRKTRSDWGHASGYANDAKNRKGFFLSSNWWVYNREWGWCVCVCVFLSTSS